MLFYKKTLYDLITLGEFPLTPKVKKLQITKKKQKQ